MAKLSLLEIKLLCHKPSCQFRAGPGFTPGATGLTKAQDHLPACMTTGPGYDTDRGVQGLRPWLLSLCPALEQFKQ